MDLIPRQHQIFAVAKICSARGGIEAMTVDREVMLRIHFQPTKHKNPVPLELGFHVGGPERDRTDDLFNAIEALSQLSYRPAC